jgi:hypothetical protein
MINNKKILDLQPETYYESKSKLNQVQSPVIMESQEEPLLANSIKSELHCASGNNFNSSMAKVFLVNNLRKKDTLAMELRKLLEMGRLSQL